MKKLSFLLGAIYLLAGCQTQQVEHIGMEAKIVATY